MMRRRQQYTSFSIGAAVLLCAMVAPASPAGAVQQDLGPLTAEEKRVVAAFDEHVKNYVKLREKMEGTLPSLSKEAKPEEIATHKKALEEAVRKARAGAQRGDVFVPEVVAYIRGRIRTEIKGSERKEVKETILEADTKGIPLRVNYPYPETKEQAEIPPTLLLRLPELPKQVKYRFVGRHMLLVDGENGLIVDYMTEALP